MTKPLQLTEFEQACLKDYGPNFERLPTEVQANILCGCLLEGICTDLNSDLPPLSASQRLILPLKRWRRRRRFRQKFRRELDHMSRALDGARVDIILSPREPDEGHESHPLSLGIQVGSAAVHPFTVGWRRCALWVVYLMIPRSSRQGLWGDLLEDRKDLLNAGLPRWQVNLVAIAEIADVVWRRPWLLRFGILVGALAVIEFLRRSLSGGGS
jgi:hypothetical protein